MVQNKDDNAGGLAWHLFAKSTVSCHGAPSISVTSFTGSSFAEAYSFWSGLSVFLKVL